MRSLVIALLIFMWLPFVLFRPHIGILVWDWISHMNPHQQTFGFAETFPFLDFVAALTVVGMVASKEKKKLPMHPIVVCFLIYAGWIMITTLAAFDVGNTVEKLTQVIKVFLFACLAITVMQTENRLKAFIWIMGLSMAFIGVKGGLYTIMTGGSGRVQGAGGMMGDNNQLAMAMAMTVPLALYFVRHPPMPRLKWPLRGASVLIMVAILGTQSRGGFAALAAVIFMLLLKTKRKIAMVALLIPIAIGAYAFMPDSYRNRIKSSETATEDSSFMGRVVMWKFSANLADDNPVEGGGFNVFYVRRALELYLPPGHEGRAPHSAYFEVLAEHGYTGLILWLTIMFTGYYSAGTAARRLRRYDQTVWLGDLCSAIQLSIIGFAVGGLTVNIATFDYYYHLLAVVVMATVLGEKIIARGEVQERELPEDQAPQVRKKWSPHTARNAVTRT